MGFCGPWAQGPGTKSPGQRCRKDQEGTGRQREGPGHPRAQRRPKKAQKVFVSG